MDNNKVNEGKQNNNSTFLTIILVVIAFVGATLPFHYIPGDFYVFPKENLTFNNTFIFSDDIQKMVDRYNNCQNIFEQQAIKNEYLHQKLVERRLILNKSNSENPLSENESESSDEKKEGSLEELPIVVRKKFSEWENYLIENSIFDYVTEEDCNQEEKMLQLYENDKYPMHIVSARYLSCDLNYDEIDDYVISYSLDNCVQGSGRGNDIIVLKSESKSKYQFDKEWAHNLNKAFLNYAKETVGDDEYVFLRDGYIYARGLNIEDVRSYEVSGTFELKGEGANCCPQIKGDFKYTTSSKEFFVSSVTKEEEPVLE